MLAAKSTEHYLVRAEIELAPLSLPDWLKDQECDTKIYWACRQEDLEIAAFGLVESIDSTNTSSFEEAVLTVEKRLTKSSSQVRYYGGQCFDPENIDPAVWAGFDRYRFIVPQYEIIRKDDTYILAQNALADSETDADQLKQQLQEFMGQTLLHTDSSIETTPDNKGCQQFRRNDVPCRSEWIAQARKLIGAIQEGGVKKVVLANKAELISSLPFNPAALLECMKGLSRHTYTFLYQFPNSGAFLGASPECLFRKDGTDICSEAIAGTRAMTGDDTTDLQLQDELRRSPKELQEHDYVADDIQTALQAICRDVCCVESRDILQTTSIQHLYTRFRGKLKDNINTFHILNALHPTAAVNGTPFREATEHIRKMEPFSRGWYAGAIGWITSEQAEFAVAIRSALVQEQTLSIYSGAGIVKDSDPEQEWEETELKKRLILEAAQEII